MIVERATDFGVLAREPGSAISASHLVVRDVGGTPRYGVGVIVEDGGRITLGDAYVEGAHARAIHVASCPEGATCTTASRLDAERLVAVAADPADPADAALSVVEAEVTLLSAALIGGATTALGLHHATLDAEDLFLLDVDTSGGVGLTAQLDSTATVTRALVAGRAKFGVVGLGAGTRVALTDVTIRDTRPDPATSSAGQGLQVSDATVVLTRAAFDGNFETGLAVGVGGRAELTDVRIDGTQPRAVDGRSGIGLVAIRGRVTARRLALRDNHAMGLVADGTALDAVDLAVERTRPEAATGSFGGGLQLANGATARIERAAVSGNRAFGMLIAGAGTRADLFATQVLDTASDDHGLFGHGVVADDGAIVTLTECRLNAQAQGGLVLAHGGAVAVNGVTLDDNEIGAVVFEGTLSPFDDVCLRSNQSDFAATVDVRIPNVFDAGGS